MFSLVHLMFNILVNKKYQLVMLDSVYFFVPCGELNKNYPSIILVYHCKFKFMYIIVFYYIETCKHKLM